MDEAAAEFNPEPPSPVLFSVEEANALLPRLIPILTELRDRKADLDETQRSLAGLTPAMQANGHGAAASALERRLRDIATAITEGLRAIAAMGVEVKDLDHGLIDFPSLRAGRIVYLCWRLGEGPIAFWHELDTGFAGRRPL